MPLDRTDRNPQLFGYPALLLVFVIVGDHDAALQPGQIGDFTAQFLRRFPQREIGNDVRPPVTEAPGGFLEGNADPLLLVVAVIIAQGMVCDRPYKRPHIFDILPHPQRTESLEENVLCQILRVLPVFTPFQSKSENGLQIGGCQPVGFLFFHLFVSLKAAFIHIDTGTVKRLYDSKKMCVFIRCERTPAGEKIGASEI